MDLINIPTVATSALTLTAALAWNEAAKSTIEYIYPQTSKKSLWASLSYAILVTLIVATLLTIIRLIYHLEKKKDDLINSKLTII